MVLAISMPEKTRQCCECNRRIRREKGKERARAVQRSAGREPAKSAITVISDEAGEVVRE